MSNDLQATHSNSAMNSLASNVPAAQSCRAASPANAQEASARQLYRAPTLRLLGSVQDLTLGTTTGPAEMGQRGQ
jgi:hypothetical protein